MKSDSLLSQTFADFGLEHLLVLFMLMTSVLLVGIAFERALTIGWIRLSVRSTRATIEAAAASSILDAAAAAQVPVLADSDLVPGGQSLNIGGDDVAWAHRYTHAKDCLGKHAVGTR